MRTWRRIRVAVRKVIFAIYVMTITPDMPRSRRIHAYFPRCLATFALDSHVLCGVVCITQSDEKNQSARPQDRSASTARHPQSTSEHRGRSAFCYGRVFRCPRSGADQVRDGSARACRWRVRHAQRRGLRILAPLFLSGADCPRARWAIRAGAQASGAASLAQTIHGSDGLPPARAFAGRVAELDRALTPSPGALQAQCAYTQRRACTRSTKKKRR